MSEAKPTLVEIQEVFFRAMLESSWASGGEAHDSVGLPFTKHVSWRDGHWIVIDRWTSIPGSDVSYGSTTIFFQGRPVWIKHFEGEYTKEASALVKQALLAAWSQQRFYAARGESRFIGVDAPGLVYFNHLDGPRHGDQALDPFAKFSCYEEVYDLGTEERLGWHRVSGMALI